MLYADSTSCSGRFISHLTDYYEVHDSLQAHNGELVVGMQPQNGRADEVKTRLRQEKYPFWCILDMTGEFSRKNAIPDNRLLHTFTLDANNKVILVGDPTQNGRIKELFYREILK